jgi:ABC-2 type transport system permease protein
MSQTLGYLGTLFWTNLRAGFARPGTAVAQLVLMFANNLIFFIVWALYFDRFPDLRGWGKADVALLYGISAFGFGLMIAVFGGMREIARAIVDGSLDVHLGRPRHPLPSLLMSRSIPSGIGDVLSAPVLWLWLGEKSLADLPLLVLLSTAAGIVMMATIGIAQCVVFWWPAALKLAEQFWELVIMITVYPQHVFGPGVRLVLFTLLPIAFMSQVPVEAIREADPLKALSVVAAALFYGALAIVVFDRGLRHYASGNRMVVNR